MQKNKAGSFGSIKNHLNSIYDYLLSIYKKQQPDKKILIYKDNDYINTQPLIDNKNINLDNLNEKLVLLLQNV